MGILVGAAALAFANNSRALVVSMEYAKETMRGGNELTVTPDALYHNGQKERQNNANGLNIDYAFGDWSYGIGETHTLLVPNALGGPSSSPAEEGSECAKYLSNTFPTEEFREMICGQVLEDILAKIF